MIVGVGCHAPPERVPAPYPAVAGLDDAACVAALQSRTRGVESAYALLSMAFDGPERSGTIDAAVQWRAPHALRVTAFKDLVLSARDVFDLLLGDVDYAFVFHDDDAPVRARGPVASFPSAHPRFATFYWAGEALLLAGAVGDEGRVVARSDELVQVEARLRNGAAVTWTLSAANLTPFMGRIVAPGERVLTIRYHGWVEVDGRVLPREVSLDDPSAGFAVRFEASDLEVNVELDPQAFDPAGVGE